MHISESFQQLLRVDQESAWCDGLFDFGRGLGFDRCLVAIMPKPGMGLEQAYLRSNYPADWRSFYDTRKLVHVDPTVAHCVAHSTSLIWSPGLFRSGPQRVMYEEASGYGLRSVLTGRELECLKWTMAGKTSWEIGRILGISVSTVNFHVAGFNRKLEVSHRNQAVIKALKLGILQP